MQAIEKADDYLLVKMWERAWSILENLPEHLKNHPDVLLRKVDVLAGSELSSEALTLAQGIVSVYPERAEAWLRLARLQAQAGALEAAREAARTCVELDRSMRLEFVEDAGLAGIW